MIFLSFARSLTLSLPLFLSLLNIWLHFIYSEHLSNVQNFLKIENHPCWTYRMAIIFIPFHVIFLFSGCNMLDLMPGCGQTCRNNWNTQHVRYLSSYIIPDIDLVGAKICSIKRWNAGVLSKCIPILHIEFHSISLLSDNFHQPLMILAAYLAIYNEIVWS